MVPTDFVQLGQVVLHRHEGSVTDDITMAFQPIADLELRVTFAYEALVRGGRGEGAGEVFDRIPHSGRCDFDKFCCVTALALAAKLNLRAILSLNVRPSTLAGGGFRTALLAAYHYAIPPEKLIFELTEDECASDMDSIRAALGEVRAAGARVALDDLGAGFAGLNLLADLRPDLVKLDRGLVRGIETSRSRRAIVKGVLGACREDGIEVIAEGVESTGELSALQDLGVRYVQGYLLARPVVAVLPSVAWPPDHDPLTEALAASCAATTLQI